MLWDAVQTNLDAQPLPPPVPLAAAASHTGQTPPADAAWLALGPWPPVERWQPPRGEPPQPPGEPTHDPLLSARPGEGGNRIHTLAIRRSGEPHETFTQESAPAAFADILTTGGGCMPRLTAVRRLGDAGELLLLAGFAPAPGLQPGSDTQWLLLIDNLRHRAWSAWWNDDAAG
jgi:hypothetical protein